MKTITIIVPCFNEEEVLHILYEEVQKYLIDNYKYNLVFVNDGSRDKTLSILKELSKKDERVKYVSFSRNFGKEAAMLAGLRTAKELKSDAAIIIDADMQDPPSLIPTMIKEYEAGYKFVYAKHKTRAGEPKLKTFFALMFYKIYASLTKNKNMAKGSRDFCLLDNNVIDAFISIKDYKRFTKGIFSWVGFDKKCVEFDYVPRVAGTTKWGFKKLFRYAIEGIHQFSRLFLLVPKLFLFISIMVFIGDLGYGIIKNDFRIYNYVFEVLFIMVFTVLLFIMKLIYELRDQVNHRPPFIVADSNVSGE